MRSFCLLLLAASAAFAQPVGFGIKGGLPLSDVVDAATSGRFTASTYTNRYIVGPTVELRLPFGFGIEADFLYRHFRYGSTSLISAGSSVVTDTSSGAWEFPLLAKYKFKGHLVRPYVAAGVSWDKISGLKQSVKSIVNNVSTVSTTSNPFELKEGVTRGIVMGAGLDVKVLLIHVSPELRFTRWGARHFIDSANNLVNSKQNQAEFLVGFTF